ncbi:hypothetical protein F5Y13DRAFT_184551 [Hypoxylon sp. FL1857]|nr:hypothetical protein F5Y13DRAFT_184551 [Hypoxylon sp. FL1857]
MPDYSYPGFPFLDDEINEIRRYFDQADQEICKWVGPLESRSGSLSVHVRVLDYFGETDAWRDVVIKRPLGNGQESIEDEWQRLRELRGLHLVQQLILPFDPLDRPLPQPENQEDFYEWGGQIYASGNGSYAVPYLVLEYLENGTLKDLIRKAREGGVTLPNILLWGLFRCLMVGKCYPHTVDHRICPMLKVANFGRSNFDEPSPFAVDETTALRENLKAVGMVKHPLFLFSFSSFAITAFEMDFLTWLNFR